MGDALITRRGGAGGKMNEYENSFIYDGEARLEPQRFVDLDFKLESLYKNLNTPFVGNLRNVEQSNVFMFSEDTFVLFRPGYSYESPQVRIAKIDLDGTLAFGTTLDVGLVYSSNFSNNSSKIVKVSNNSFAVIVGKDDSSSSLALFEINDKNVTLKSSVEIKARNYYQYLYLESFDIEEENRILLVTFCDVDDNSAFNDCWYKISNGRLTKVGGKTRAISNGSMTAQFKLKENVLLRFSDNTSTKAVQLVKLVPKFQYKTLGTAINLDKGFAIHYGSTFLNPEQQIFMYSDNKVLIMTDYNNYASIFIAIDYENLIITLNSLIEDNNKKGKIVKFKSYEGYIGYNGISSIVPNYSRMFNDEIKKIALFTTDKLKTKDTNLSIVSNIDKNEAYFFGYTDFFNEQKNYWQIVKATIIAKEPDGSISGVTKSEAIKGKRVEVYTL